MISHYMREFKYVLPTLYRFHFIVNCLNFGKPHMFSQGCMNLATSLVNSFQYLSGVSNAGVHNLILNSVRVFLGGVRNLRQHVRLERSLQVSVLAPNFYKMK